MWHVLYGFKCLSLWSSWSELLWLGLVWSWGFVVRISYCIWCWRLYCFSPLCMSMSVWQLIKHHKLHQFQKKYKFVFDSCALCRENHPSHYAVACDCRQRSLVLYVPIQLLMSDVHIVKHAQTCMHVPDRSNLWHWNKRAARMSPISKHRWFEHARCPSICAQYFPRRHHHIS